MPSSKATLPLLIAALVAASPASAQTVAWQVVAGNSAVLAVPGFPAGSRSYSDVYLADRGAGLIGIRMNSPTASEGYWARRQGSWVRHTAIGATGGTLGPGRLGGEAAHAFLSVDSGGTDAGADGQRVFVARAGDPANTVNATRGVWRWDTNQNIEVARVLTDGALGPGLGANTVFTNNSNFADVRMGNAGRVLINADVTLATTGERRVLAKHVPGQGNVACMLRGSTNPAVAPGLQAGDTFDASWTLASIALTPGGRAYGAFSASNSRSGIWEVCNGAPRAVVADGVPGALGPEIGLATASFVSGSFGTPRPAAENRFYFSARYRTAVGQTSAGGLFWHDGAANRPLAMNDGAGVYGPHWEGSTWSDLYEASLVGAGDFAAFEGAVRTPDATTVSGLWRVQAGGSPQPVAIIGATGAYAPEANRTWASFYAKAQLANGDILLHARTNPNSEVALWLLQPGAAPRRVLADGQVVTVPTSGGNAQDTVQSFSIDSGNVLAGGGTDSWVGADGSVLVYASLATHGGVRLLANPLDRLFRNGFDP